MEALWATILFSGFALEVIIRPEKYVNVGGEAIKVLFLSRSHYLSK